MHKHMPEVQMIPVLLHTERSHITGIGSSDVVPCLLHLSLALDSTNWRHIAPILLFKTFAAHGSLFQAPDQLLHVQIADQHSVDCTSILDSKIAKTLHICVVGQKVFR